MIADDVLRRLRRVVQVVGPIVVVMVAFLLPVQRGVLHVGQRVYRRTSARVHHRLPEHGKQHHEEDEGAAHFPFILLRGPHPHGDSGRSRKQDAVHQVSPTASFQALAEHASDGNGSSKPIGIAAQTAALSHMADIDRV